MNVYDEKIICISLQKHACCRACPKTRNAVILTYYARYINRHVMRGPKVRAISFPLVSFLISGPKSAEHKKYHDNHDYDICGRRNFEDKSVRNES
jgi:hypothetical protein